MLSCKPRGTKATCLITNCSASYGTSSLLRAPATAVVSREADSAIGIVDG